ncbi:hypothetical protein [Moheibacter sp.]|uniref:hypothetical protein n=1 Tax=Moheibacter sp. TaxID=1965316 RepID=UPI003C7449BB
MKKIFLLIFFLLIQYSFGQISTTRMNEIRLQSSLADIENALGQKLDLSKKLEEWFYSTKVTHKGSEFLLNFSEYSDENNQMKIQLFEISTQSASVKTLSNIGVGSSLEDLWKAYKNYNISIWRLWDDKSEKYSTTERVFQLNDYEAGTALYFYLRNDKIYKITLSFSEGC